MEFNTKRLVTKLTKSCQYKNNFLLHLELEKLFAKVFQLEIEPKFIS